MQYLTRLHSCLTFNLQNEAALLWNKTTQSQSSYYTLFCGDKCYLKILFMKHHHFFSSYFIRCRTAPKAGENSLFLLAELEGWFRMLSQNCSFPLNRSKSPAGSTYSPSISNFYNIRVLFILPWQLTHKIILILRFKKNPNALDPSALKWYTYKTSGLERSGNERSGDERSGIRKVRKCKAQES